MADINLNINILDGANCPTIEYINEDDLSIVVNEGSPILEDNSTTVAVPQDTTVTIVVEKEGYDSYNQSIDVGATDETIFIVLSETIPVDFINISQSCHSYTFTNNGTTEEQDVTYTITDLDDNVIGDNEDVELAFGASTTFTSTADNIYLVIVKDTDEAVIRIYIIIDYCNIRKCLSNRILAIICDCGCQDNDCTDYCKKDFEMKRIFLLQFDLFNRINREYRLNSYYTTIDDLDVNNLKTAQELMNKLNEYCGLCNETTQNYNAVLSNYSTTNSGCGCS